MKRPVFLEDLTEEDLKRFKEEVRLAMEKIRPKLDKLRTNT